MDPSPVKEGGFWDGKVPCWVVRDCAPEARRTCQAYLDQSRPCWELEDTLCKKMLGIDTCFMCKVHELNARL